MKREPKTPTGECDCPIRNCTHVKLPVFKYRSQTGDPSRQRFAGRLYVQCPKHGRVEADQEFILENGKLWAEGHGPKDASATGQSVPSQSPPPVKPATAPPVKAPVQSTSKPASAPVVTPPKKEGGFFL